MSASSEGNHPTRRGVLQSGAGVTLGGVLGLPVEADAAQPLKADVYRALGLKHVINAIGTVTFLGGSVMPPEVVAA